MITLNQIILSLQLWNVGVFLCKETFQDLAIKQEKKGKRLTANLQRL